MKTVWKYQVKFVDLQLVEIPISGTIIDVGFQERLHNPTIWVLFDKDEMTPKQVWLGLNGTGHDISPKTPHYIKTVPQGAFIWHFFYGDI